MNQSGHIKQNAYKFYDIQKTKISPFNSYHLRLNVCNKHLHSNKSSKPKSRLFLFFKTKDLQATIRKCNHLLSR